MGGKKLGVRYCTSFELTTRAAQRDIVGNKTQAETVGCQIGYRTRTNRIGACFPKCFALCVRTSPREGCRILH